MKYSEARDLILEPTWNGYTLRSQDRIWVPHIYDTWSTNTLRGNRLYFLPNLRGMSYELWDDELVFTSLREAEQFRAEKQAEFDEDGDKVTVYLFNLGDDRRWERWLLEGIEYKPRFKHGQETVAVREHFWNNPPANLTDINERKH